MTVAAAILAAGAGSRFGDGSVAKLRAEFRGRPLVQWAVDAALEAAFDELFVVTGAVDLHDLLPDPVHLVHNDGWQRGIATSLGRAVEVADHHGHDVLVVGLGDQPFLTTEAWRAVARASSPIVVATYGGERGNPVRLAREAWTLLPSDGDVGARTLMAARPDLVVEVPCSGSALDLDTQEDFARWS